MADTLWKKCQRAAKVAGAEVVQKALWLHFAAQSDKTPAWAKGVIYGALAYFLLPTDVIPDFLPAVGYSDDLGALVAAVATVSMHIDDEVKAKADERLRAWGLTGPSEK